MPRAGVFAASRKHMNRLGSTAVRQAGQQMRRGSMAKIYLPLILTALFTSTLSIAGSAQSVGNSSEVGRDWTTWGYDQERSGWNRGERVLTPQNVSRLAL